MLPAVFIARLAGPLFVVIGVGIVLNEAAYAAVITEAVRSPTLIYFSGLLALVPGLAILNVHGRWTADWRDHHTRLAVGDRRRDPHRAAADDRQSREHDLFRSGGAADRRRRLCRAGRLAQLPGLSAGEQIEAAGK